MRLPSLCHRSLVPLHSFVTSYFLNLPLFLHFDFISIICCGQLWTLFLAISTVICNTASGSTQLSSKRFSRHAAHTCYLFPRPHYRYGFGWPDTKVGADICSKTHSTDRSLDMPMSFGELMISQGAISQLIWFLPCSTLHDKPQPQDHRPLLQQVL